MNLITRGDIQAIMEIEDLDIDQRGAFGETILHTAFLTNKDEVAKYFIDAFPELIPRVYENPLYLGETALHMAVANRKLEMVKKLLTPLSQEERLALMETRATGDFFQKNVDTNESVSIWYGETALAFAIVTEQQDIVNYLVEMGADLMQEDAHGDSLFHLCIYKNLYDMFNFLLELYDHKNGMDKGARLKLFNDIKNKKNQTLIDHAAFLGRFEIFERILQLTSEVGWVWGDLEYRCYPVSDIDDNNDAKQESILEVIVAEGHRSFQKHNLIKYLINKKWRSFGRNAFII